jgi:N-acetylglucosamine malate deacetylase 1
LPPIESKNDETWEGGVGEFFVRRLWCPPSALHASQHDQVESVLLEKIRSSALVLAPHPDDETFGCGGTIRMLSHSGVAVDVAFLTRGEQGLESMAEQPLEGSSRLAEIRSCEARAACDVLGVRNVHFLNGLDQRLGESLEVEELIHGLLHEHQYPRVFCPWPHDAHEDHRAAFSFLRQAVARNAIDCSFWLYEVWTPLPANTFVPIDGTWPAKRQAMEQYQSQISQHNYREGFLGLAAYRSLFCPASQFAEAFLVCNSPELLSLR